MALINPELIALARVRLVYTSGSVTSATYQYSNGFDAVEVDGAKPGAAPIFIDGTGPRAQADGIVLFLTDPNQPGNPASAPNTAPSQAGIKAVFSIVNVATPSNPLPVVFGGSGPSGDISWQYGDYSLAGTTLPVVLPSTLYANVNPQKALRFIPVVGFEGSGTLDVDVSVFKNPMTLYK